MSARSAWSRRQLAERCRFAATSHICSYTRASARARDRWQLIAALTRSYYPCVWCVCARAHEREREREREGERNDCSYVIRIVSTLSHGSDCVSEQRASQVSRIHLARVTFRFHFSILFFHRLSLPFVSLYTWRASNLDNMCGKYISTSTIVVAVVVAFSADDTIDVWQIRFIYYTQDVTHSSILSHTKRCYRVQFDSVFGKWPYEIEDWSWRLRPAAWNVSRFWSLHAGIIELFIDEILTSETIYTIKIYLPRYLLCIKNKFKKLHVKELNSHYILVFFWYIIIFLLPYEILLILAYYLFRSFIKPLFLV